jgi:hypothetical protein
MLGYKSDIYCSEKHKEIIMSDMVSDCYLEII